MSTPAANHVYFGRSMIELEEHEAEMRWTPYGGGDAANGTWSMDNFLHTNASLPGNSDPQWTLPSRLMADSMTSPTSEYTAMSSPWMDQYQGAARYPFQETHPYSFSEHHRYPFPSTQHPYSVPFEQQYGSPGTLPVDAPLHAAPYTSHSHYIGGQQLGGAGRRHRSSIVPERPHPYITTIRTATEPQPPPFPSTTGLAVTTTQTISFGRRCEFDGCTETLYDLSISAINKHLRSYHIRGGRRDSKAAVTCLWRVGEWTCRNKLLNSNVGKHIASTHLKSTVARCSNCGKEFSRTDVMVKHQKRSCPRRQ